MANTKLSAFFSLLLVFCSGVGVGVVGYRAYSSSLGSAPKTAEKRTPPNPEEFRKQAIQEMTTEVHLDPTEVNNLVQIYDNTKTQFDEMHTEFEDKSRSIRDDQIKKIREMLRPDQVPLFDALHARKEAERAARRRSKGGIVQGDRGDKGSK
jgi:hypothetical protein